MANNKSAKKAAKTNLRKQSKFSKDEYYLGMLHAQGMGKNSPVLQMLPILVFGAFVILIVVLHIYYRPMEQFAWTTDTSSTGQTDIFSFGKALVITICAAISLCGLASRAINRELAIKKSPIYIPMAVYSLFIILSYAFSDLKEFAIWGWNERFEGTIPLLAYMVMLFYIINTVNSEKNVKQVIGCLGISSVILGLLGVTQAVGYDFFRTIFGQKLITLFYGGDYWDAIEECAEQGTTYLTFTFTGNEIYQTVYNINYVAFYLTLLIPLFAMLFLYLFKEKSSPLWEKIVVAFIIALCLYNFVGASSAGGYLGLAAAVIVAIILLARHLKSMLKPLCIVAAVIVVGLGVTVSRWLPELKTTLSSLAKNNAGVQLAEDVEGDIEPGSLKPYLDYIETKNTHVVFCVNGNELNIWTVLGEDGQPNGVVYKDSEGNVLETYDIGDREFAFKDERFYPYVKTYDASDSESGVFSVLLTPNASWIFRHDKTQTYYQNLVGNFETLTKVESIGFEGHYNLGTGRGGIWALTIPLFKDRIILGSGADTFCGVFPNNAYANKYNHTEDGAQNIVYDKAHNMYFGTIIGSGLISLIAQLAIFVIYIVQSIRVFGKKPLDGGYLNYIAVGIFLGVVGFLVSGLVNDSSVSVMPMFYTLLGTGIAINGILKHKQKEETASAK